MHRHRLWLVATICWLFLLHQIERAYEPFDVPALVYLVGALAGVGTLLVGPLRTRPVAVALATLLLFYLCCKTLWGHPLAGSHLLATAAELGAIAVTSLLTIQLGRIGDEFIASLGQLVTMQRGRSVPSYQDIEPSMRREMRRARRFRRPLSIVRIHLEEISCQASLDGLIRQLEKELISDYVGGRIAELLQTETKSSDILADAKGQFVLLLPETDSDDANKLAERLRCRCQETLGMAVGVGAAGFPDDELTLSGLLDHALDGQCREHPRREQDRRETEAVLGVVGATAISPDLMAEDISRYHV